MGYIAQNNLHIPSLYPYEPSLVVYHHFTIVHMVHVSFIHTNSVVKLGFQSLQLVGMLIEETSPWGVEPV